MGKETVRDDTTVQGIRALTELQLVLEATGVGMWTYDGATNQFDMDATCRGFLDLDPDEEATGEKLAARLYPDDLERYRDALHETTETGEFAVEFRLVREDGSIRFMSGRGYALQRQSRNAPIIKGVFIDVTDRVTLENQLRSTAARMQHLADSMPGLFSYIDKNYIVRFMSSHYRQLVELDEAEPLDRHFREVFGDEAFEGRKPRIDRALVGETVHYEADRIMPDGKHHFFAVAYEPFRDHTGDIRGVICLAMDITERRHMERRLERQTQELARSNRDLEQFAYVASHDLKAPLRAIETLVDWLHEDLAEYREGDVQENLELLKQRTRRLNRLLDDLLTYSRAGRNGGDLRRVDSREMVADIATLLAPPDSMTVEADASLPVLTAYHASLEQVLRNLINNAIKHHPTQEGRVRVYAEDQGSAVMFAVEDDGAGIPEEYAKKVFQMFQTLQPRDDREGSGMGLAIVKRIVDWQGGRIWFHPGPGDKGTVFKFTWTKLDDDSADTEKEGSSDERENDAARQYSVG